MIYTDGSTVGNGSDNAVGTYAFLFKPEINNPNEPLRVYAAKHTETTNNRMEMMAAICGISLCMIEHPNAPMQIVSDSKYLVDGVTKPSYLDKWLSNGWKLSNKQPVKNRDLWEQLNKLRWQNGIIWTHIRGHGGCKDYEHAYYNDICDRACNYVYRLKSGKRYVLEYDKIAKKFEIVS